MSPEERDKIRCALADYMHTEGCGCCQDVEEHAEARRRLAELLEVPMFSDGSGYDFSQFCTKG